MTHTDRSVPETKGVDVELASASIRPEPSSVEAAVKPLVWDTDPLGNMLAVAACGWATVEVRSDGRWRWSLGGVAAGTERRKEDALKMLNNSYETRIRSALENPPVALADANKNARELAERDSWVTHWQTKCQATNTLLQQERAVSASLTLSRDEALEALRVEREAVIAECLAAIDALKDFVPANPQGRVRFSIYDLTRAFRAGVSMAREDIEALRARSVLAQGDRQAFVTVEDVERRMLATSPAECADPDEEDDGSPDPTEEVLKGRRP